MRKIFSAVAGVAALAATPALAQQTATSTMDVVVNVVDSCQVGATTMDFGSPTSIGGTAINGTSTVSVTCTVGANYNVAMGFGGGATGAGPTLQRNMTGQTDNTKVVPYNIYSNSARTTKWGNTIGTDTVAVTNAAATTNQITAYGQIPSTASAVPAQAYKDQVTVTVTF